MPSCFFFVPFPYGVWGRGIQLYRFLIIASDLLLMQCDRRVIVNDAEMCKSIENGNVTVPTELFI